MRNLWLPQAGRDNAEVEALQADVMRFVAIIGLVLAAIFSLTQGKPEVVPASQSRVVTAPVAKLAQTAVKPVKAELQTTRQPLLKTPTVPPAPVPPKSKPMTVPNPPEQGFSLEFSDEAALYRLIGAHSVQLYAVLSGQALRWDVAQKGFSAAALPASFYQMDTSTVPAVLQQALAQSIPAMANNFPTGTVSWGVVMAASISEEIDAILASHTHGSIVIQSDGTLNWQSGER